jgi:hypothetical protein
MSIEFHQPDIASEVAEHEDDLIGRGDWRSAREAPTLTLELAVPETERQARWPVRPDATHRRRSTAHPATTADF